MKSASDYAIDRIRQLAPPTGDARRAMMDERLSPMAAQMTVPNDPYLGAIDNYLQGLSGQGEGSGWFGMNTIPQEMARLQGVSDEYGGLSPEYLQAFGDSALMPGPGVMGTTKAAGLLDNAAAAADGLPMDTASQMARANQTFPVDAWHGSPRNITEFRNTYSTPEGHYGPHHYFTNSIDDVNANYATHGGPDITQRIQREIELAADSFDDDTILDYWQYRDVDVDDIADLSQGQIDEALDAVARERLGIENDGTVYPVRLAMNNPVRVGGDGETFFDYNIKYSADGEDIVGEDGPFVDLLEATQEAFDEWQIDQYTRDDVLSKLMDDAIDGGISASDFDNILRSNINEVYDDFSGEMASPGAVIADIFKKAGFDSIDMDASVFNNRQGFGGVKLPGMTGTQDARHYVIFDDNANQIRSRFAKFDPRNIKSRDLLASGAGGLLGLGLLGNTDAEAGQ